MNRLAAKVGIEMSEINRQHTPANHIDEHPFELRHEIKHLNGRLDKISEMLEKAEIADILQTYSNPKKRIISNLTAGIARGLGLSLGTIIVIALLAWLLSALVQLNLPVIGDFLAELLKYVDAARAS